ncbi:MAG: hypothetical protein AAB676_17700 [Verrucomicrobiota bacterium]
MLKKTIIRLAAEQCLSEEKESVEVNVEEFAGKCAEVCVGDGMKAKPMLTSSREISTVLTCGVSG